MTTAPADPQSGDDILDWAKEVTALLRSIIPRESADITVRIRGTGTTYHIRRRAQPAPYGGTSSPLGM